MKHKVADLEGDLLDAAVAKAEGLDDVTHTLVIMRDGTETFVPYGPSTHWAIGGPIIEREWIGVAFVSGEPQEAWQAATDGWQNLETGKGQCGPTPLIAAMRAYVASKLGDEIDLPQADVADDAESLVAQFGEQYRRLIVDALAFLDETEPQWNLARPMNRREYIKDIIRKAGAKP